MNTISYEVTVTSQNRIILYRCFSEQDVAEDFFYDFDKDSFELGSFDKLEIYLDEKETILQRGL